MFFKNQQQFTSSCIISLCILSPIFAYNVNINKIRVLDNQPETGSLFGFSMALCNSDEGSLDALVGAPDSNTTQGGLKSGTVYRYKNILNSSNLTKESIYYSGPKNMVNDTHDEGFGSTVLMTDSRDLLVCSPGWKDTDNVTTSFHTYMLGRCVLQTQNQRREMGPYHEPDAKRKYKTSQFFWKGMSAFGSSADMDNNVIVFGAPGVFNAEGSVQVYNITSGKESIMHTKLESNLRTTSYGFLGYSVKLGRFCNDSFSGVCFAAGAPNVFQYGQVQIFFWNETLKHNLKIQDINGTEMWSNFGYSLGVVSLENEGYDQLLVGAPLYTEWGNPNHISDQGVVYQYYYSSDTKKYDRKYSHLDGSKQSFARFGSAIANIGDINLDEFPDVAIGAPGENDGAGSVYIYLGSATGFINSPSQRIQASQITVPKSHIPMRSFGFAISNKQIPEKKSYPVFAASSVVSELVTVFQCRPIVEVEANLKAFPNPINLKSPCNLSSDIQGSCFKVILCLKHKVKGEQFQNQSFNIQLDSDTKMKSPALKRALFRSDKQEYVHTVSKSGIKVTSPTNSTCSEFIAILKETLIKQDRFTPIQIVAYYWLAPSKNPANDLILDASKPNNITTEILLVNECGSDAKCEVNLKVDVDVFYLPSNDKMGEIVFNYTREFKMHIEIKNRNETAYGIVVNIEIDTFVAFIKSKSEPNCESTLSDMNITDSLLVFKDKTMIVCSFYEPLHSEEEVKFNLLFDTNENNMKKNDLQMKIEVMPKNQEHNPEIFPEDNLKVLKSKVYIVSNITLESLSSPKEHTIYERSLKSDFKSTLQESEKHQNLLNVTHKVLVQNTGPSFLPNTVITVEIPQFAEDGSAMVTQAEVKMFSPEGEIHCEKKSNFNPSFQLSTTSTTTIVSTTEEFIDGRLNRKRRASNTNCEGKKCFMACKENQHLCQVYACELNTIVQPKGYVEINVTLILNMSNIDIAQDVDTLEFVSHVEVQEPRHPLFKSWAESKRKPTITTFHFIQSGRQINIWIIVGSIIAGLVLITIIVIVLWKVGFFKRTKHLEVQQKKRESSGRFMKDFPQ